MFTLEKAIQCASREAVKKQLVGKLFSSFDDSKESRDFTNGDPETLFSIATMYGNMVEDVEVDVAIDKIEDHLCKEFPSFV